MYLKHVSVSWGRKHYVPQTCTNIHNLVVALYTELQDDTTDGEAEQISVYCFLQLHVNVQMSQNKV